VKQLGFRAGNWLNRDQPLLLLSKSDGESLRNTRDVAMISILLGCGLRRAELASLRRAGVQIRQGRRAIVDLVGKGGRLRTVPMPDWLKDAVDRWLTAVAVRDGNEFREVSRHGSSWGNGVLHWGSEPSDSRGLDQSTIAAQITETSSGDELDLARIGDVKGNKASALLLFDVEVSAFVIVRVEEERISWSLRLFWQIRRLKDYNVVRLGTNLGVDGTHAAQGQ
jgi:Phage integrase family